MFRSLWLTRRPTAEMLMAHFDTLLIDLQDLGWAASTPSSPLCCMCCKRLHSMANQCGCSIGRTRSDARSKGHCCDRVGRSFAGAADAYAPHGLTLGELAHWFVKTNKLDVEYRVIAMHRWQPGQAPGHGWPLGERAPGSIRALNAANLFMARCYAGTVLLEGTTLSEGRGTTRPL
ncbi:MAG: DUF1343 domain-containing protein [Steroidobacteraceae bacterium]